MTVNTLIKMVGLQPRYNFDIISILFRFIIIMLTRIILKRYPSINSIEFPSCFAPEESFARPPPLPELINQWHTDNADVIDSHRYFNQC